MITSPTDIKINVVPPVYGLTYSAGWGGFVRSPGFVSNAIAYGERWERFGGYPEVTHALLVTGSGQCIEAQQGSGVSTALLSNYLNDPYTKVYFREPLNLSEDSVKWIVSAATSMLGCHYNDLLIAEDVVADTYIGHLFNEVLKGWPHIMISTMLGRNRCFICSMLLAYALNAAPAYRGVDVLSHAPATLDPQILFESKLFAPFVNDCSFRPGLPPSTLRASA